MERLNLYTVKLKLKRHKIKFIELEGNNAIQLGGATIKGSHFILNVIIPLGFSITTIILMFTQIIPPTLKFIWYVVGVAIVYGFTNLAALFFKLANNKNVKKIEPGKVSIISDGKSIEVAAEQLRDLTYEIERSENDIVTKGKLFLFDLDNRKHNLLTIVENEGKYIEEDLVYFRYFFEMVVKSSK